MLPKSSRLGLVLFAIYLALYSGFVLLNTFAPDTMEATPWAGINVAILYGCGLILAAVVLALIYGVYCGVSEEQSSEEQS
ncbi:MAG: DUF485 domain-containing protein [Bythopirellula sp.]|nr:DUF485 domain-containing protein [Bythopirellula sp.]